MNAIYLQIDQGWAAQSTNTQGEINHGTGNSPEGQCARFDKQKGGLRLTAEMVSKLPVHFFF